MHLFIYFCCSHTSALHRLLHILTYKETDLSFLTQAAICNLFCKYKTLACIIHLNDNHYNIYVCCLLSAKLYRNVFIIHTHLHITFTTPSICVCMYVKYLQIITKSLRSIKLISTTYEYN